jgi:hypothetical protein
MPLATHPFFDAVGAKRLPELHRKVSETIENKVALFEPAYALIEDVGRPLVMQMPYGQMKYHHGWDIDAVPVITGMELPDYTSGQQDTKVLSYNYHLIRGGFSVDLQTIFEEMSTGQDSSASPSTDSMLTSFERNAERNINILKQLMGRWFLRGDFNVDGRLAAAKEAKLLGAIKGVTTIWGEDSTSYYPRGVTSHGLLQFATPADQAISARAPYGLTKYVGTDDDMGWYNQYVQCNGPETVHAMLQRLAGDMSLDPHYQDGNAPDVAYADNETIQQLAEHIENKVLHVMDSSAPTPGLQKRGAELIMSFSREFGRPVHIMQFGNVKLPVFNTPAYQYSRDTKIQTLGGIMVGLCTKDWRRLQFSKALNDSIATGGIEFFPAFSDSQFAIGDFRPDPEGRFAWKQDWLYGVGHVVEQLRTHFTASGTVSVDETA